MSYKAPTRGNLLQLWDKINPEQGYSREEIEKIAKDNAISDYTVGNLLNTRREYLIFNPDDQLYYRNDSAIAAQIPTPAKSSVSRSAKAKKTKPATSKSVASKSTQSKPATSKSVASKSTQSKSTSAKAADSTSVEPQEKAKISPESIAHKIFASTERLKEAKLRKASLQSIQIFL
jgi:alpha-beta hydrolase superfamily lysophospholipase